MEVSFNTKIEKKIAKAEKEFGPQMGKKIKMRLNELVAAESVQVAQQVPHLALHPLKGARLGQFAITTTHPFRMIFEPEGIFDILDYKTIKKIKIISLMEDYH